MYSFILKYRQIILNAAVFIFLLFASSGFYREFFMGAACGAVAIALGESITDVKKRMKLRKGMECAILMSR
jgi:hypothetical protein